MALMALSGLGIQITDTATCTTLDQIGMIGAPSTGLHKNVQKLKELKPIAFLAHSAPYFAAQASS